MQLSLRFFFVYLLLIPVSNGISQGLFSYTIPGMFDNYVKGEKGTKDFTLNLTEHFHGFFSKNQDRFRYVYYDNLNNPLGLPEYSYENFNIKGSFKKYTDYYKLDINIYVGGTRRIAWSFSIIFEDLNYPRYRGIIDHSIVSNIFEEYIASPQIPQEKLDTITEYELNRRIHASYEDFLERSRHLEKEKSSINYKALLNELELFIAISKELEKRKLLQKRHRDYTEAIVEEMDKLNDTYVLHKIEELNNQYYLLLQKKRKGDRVVFDLQENREKVVEYNRQLIDKYQLLATEDPRKPKLNRLIGIIIQAYSDLHQIFLEEDDQENANKVNIIINGYEKILNKA